MTCGSYLFPGTCDNSPEIGTHVVQFFWTSALTKFGHPPAFFVTNTGSTKETRMWFWEGVQLYHSSGQQDFSRIRALETKILRYQNLTGKQELILIQFMKEHGILHNMEVT